MPGFDSEARLVLGDGEAVGDGPVLAVLLRARAVEADLSALEAAEGRVVHLSGEVDELALVRGVELPLRERHGLREARLRHHDVAAEDVALAVDADRAVERGRRCGVGRDVLERDVAVHRAVAGVEGVVVRILVVVAGGRAAGRAERDADAPRVLVEALVDLRAGRLPVVVRRMVVRRLEGVEARLVLARGAADEVEARGGDAPALGVVLLLRVREKLLDRDRHLLRPPNRT